MFFKQRVCLEHLLIASQATGLCENIRRRPREKEIQILIGIFNKNLSRLKIVFREASIKRFYAETTKWKTRIISINCLRSNPTVFPSTPDIVASISITWNNHKFDIYFLIINFYCSLTFLSPAFFIINFWMFSNSLDVSLIQMKNEQKICSILEARFEGRLKVRRCHKSCQYNFSKERNIQILLFGKNFKTSTTTIYISRIRTLEFYFCK